MLVSGLLQKLKNPAGDPCPAGLSQEGRINLNLPGSEYAYYDKIVNEKGKIISL